MDAETVVRILERNGFRATFVLPQRAEEARAEVRQLLADGLLDKGFYDEYADPYFEPKSPRKYRWPKSILIVSSPSPQRSVTFELEGKRHVFPVPPTYADGIQTNKSIKTALRDARKKDPFRMLRTFPPLKLMAVRSGLALYGRNNISYVDGFGSFQRLTAYLTDIEISDDRWDEKRALPRCAKCRACAAACPTKAIGEDRFLLRVTRCLTFMNEHSNDHSFPSWVKPSWHNSIVGCMICQRACPYNKEFLSQVAQGPLFSESETKMLLKGRLSGPGAGTVRRKLKAVGIDPATFPRNLKVLLNKTRAR